MLANKILHIILGITAFIVIPIQIVSTFVLGLLASLTFGLLLLVLSLIWMVLFFGPLMGLSYVYERVTILRPVIAIIGIPIAVLGDAYVAITPSMGEFESRFTKMLLCQTFPYTWSYNQFYTKQSEVLSPDDPLITIFEQVSKGNAPLRGFIETLQIQRSQKQDQESVSSWDSV